MSLGIIGKKVGMTRVFNDKGESVPVTVINVEPNVVLKSKQLQLTVTMLFKSPPVVARLLKSMPPLLVISRKQA